MTNIFLKGIKAELKKVVWPTKKQLINNTIIVILLVLALAAIVLTFDMIVEFLDTHLWNLIRSKID
ncbi:MAG: preprotein translocase subunit SecE [Clostridia bacterium]|nr:preprotein translocase subunit SecE [Clostridia bacterium]MDD4386783.1 preprotein translocase subunit SecE [Clostridia bacterium]